MNNNLNLNLSENEDPGNARWGQKPILIGQNDILRALSIDKTSENNVLG